MALKIPFKDYPSFKERVNLDGRPYILWFCWNVRHSYWTVTFLQVDGTVIAGAIKIVLGIELIRSYPELDLPPGELQAIDTTGALERIGRDDFVNGNAYLRYTPEDEL